MINDTKGHILNVSLILFLQKSFKEVTMKELVERSGMSKGAFYHYFESKEQLFLEVVNCIIDSADIDYNVFNKDSLYDFYHDYVAYLKGKVSGNILMQKMSYGDDGLGLNYFSLIFDAIKIFPDFRKKIMKYQQIELDSWIDIVRIARSRGEIRSAMNDDQIASIFIYSNDGVALRCIMKGTSEETYNHLLILWDSFYEGLKG